MIPQNLKNSFDMYVNHGIPTGGFLQAVLENNLMEAMGRADDWNREILFEICSYVYNDMPAACHGNKEKVRKWIEERRIE